MPPEAERIHVDEQRSDREIGGRRGADIGNGLDCKKERKVTVGNHSWLGQNSCQE